MALPSNLSLHRGRRPRPDRRSVCGYDLSRYRPTLLNLNHPSTTACNSLGKIHSHSKLRARTADARDSVAIRLCSEYRDGDQDGDGRDGCLTEVLIKLELPVPSAVKALDVDTGVVADVDCGEVSLLQRTPLLQRLSF